MPWTILVWVCSIVLSLVVICLGAVACTALLLEIRYYVKGGRAADGKSTQPPDGYKFLGPPTSQKPVDRK